jgi:hypothetical protein
MRKRCQIVGVFGGQAQADEAAPVLPDERDATQVEGVEDQCPHPLDVPGVAVVGHLGRLVRAAEPDEVRCDHPQAGRYQGRDHRPVQERPRGLAVQQQHRLAAGRAGFDPGHPQRQTAVGIRHLGVPRLVPEVGKSGEAVVGRAEGLHASENYPR